MSFLIGDTVRVLGIIASQILRSNKLTFIFLASIVIWAAGPTQAQVEYVDPTIGSVSILLVPTRPAVYLPNSMVRMYPIRTDGVDDQIQSFPLTISSHRISELFSIMPGDGNTAAYDQEKTTPYYYSVRFADSKILTEFTPTERCGYFRFTFPSGKASIVLANRMPGDLKTQDGNSIAGEE